MSTFKAAPGARAEGSETPIGAKPRYRPIFVISAQDYDEDTMDIVGGDPALEVWYIAMKQDA